jgi:hypothetical protein
MEKGIVVSCVVMNRTPESQQMFRAAAPPNGFSHAKFWAAERNKTPRE